MSFSVRLLSVPKFLVLNILFMLAWVFLFYRENNHFQNPSLFALLILVGFIPCIILSAYFSRKTVQVTLNPGQIILSHLGTIDCNNIEWINEDGNFLAEGVRFKLKNGKEHHLTCVRMFEKNSNFLLIRNHLTGETSDKHIPEKTSSQLYFETAFFRNLSIMLLLVSVSLIAFSFVGDLKVERSKLFVTGIVFLALFAASKK